MSETKATRGSGSWCHQISMTPSLTVAGTSEVTSVEESEIGSGKPGGMSVHIFPVADAMHGKKLQILNYTTT